MTGICEGRIVIVTGAGRGIGREHALGFAREGARVVVNDLGVALDGTGGGVGPAQEVVDEIHALGGEAVANTDDIADWAGAQRLVQTAIDGFGGLDVLVNNAGFVRDRMLFTTSEEEWDAVIRVHLKGHFAVTRHASAFWRAQSKAGEPVDARIVNTSSGAGLMGSVGQGAYSAAKGGIAALTLVESAEMGRYGVTANAIAPAARTRMTEEVFADRMQIPESGFDVNDPGNISPLVVWLGSTESAGVTGRVFEVEGGMISVADGWQHGPNLDKGARWDPAEVGEAVQKLLAQAPTPAPVYGAQCSRAHPAPPDVRARWRAERVWTDETLLDRLAHAGSSHLAIVDGDRRATVASLHAEAERYAAALWSRGVRPGSVVCWQLPNWSEAVAFCWAIWRCGAIASPITPALRAHEVGFILRQTGARHIAVPREFRGTRYAAMVRSTGFDGDIIEFRGTSAELETADTPPVPAVDADTVALILWTSGTTSDPKGVVHTHQSLRVEADTIAAAHAMTPGESLLLPMPITHVAGLTYGVLLPITSGITTVLMDTWEPGRALELVERERVAVMISTPVFMRTMVDHPSFARADRSSLRMFSLGGAGVAPAMVREGTREFDCWCKRTYGSTEYPTLTTGRAGDDLEHDATTDGPLIGVAELRIVDPGTLADLAPGTPGELLARGPEMFVGYLDPQLDAHAFVDGGWFRTGDLAVYDGEYLTILDRLKDIIIRGGENISAQEVEAALVTHPTIAEAACVAMPDAVMGEKVCAFVIASPGQVPVLETVRAHLVDRGLARFKLPERLEIRAVLPRTASGKVQKSPLREELLHG